MSRCVSRVSFVRLEFRISMDVTSCRRYSTGYLDLIYDDRYFPLSGKGISCSFLSDRNTCTKDFAERATQISVLHESQKKEAIADELVKKFAKAFTNARRLLESALIHQFVRTSRFPWDGISSWWTGLETPPAIVPLCRLSGSFARTYRCEGGEKLVASLTPSLRKFCLREHLGRG